jgi:hypothetical protein
VERLAPRLFTVIVVVEACAGKRNQTSFGDAAPQPLVGPSPPAYVAFCKLPVVVEQAIDDVNETELPQALLADCPKDISGIAAKDSNKIMDRACLRYNFGFIAIRIVYGRFQNSLINFLEAIVKLPNYYIITGTLYQFL